eukprot:snap_masked-scaffold14_size734282-processed-gene-2.3 protein:Tk11288 transcript:snap_masked-scaffold14_size734282-processed-gene-2.3-mRNA-1 annotation:"hypothetical protein DAPPUDRAFT_299547"
MGRSDILVLFDVDGTLTPHRKVILPHVEQFLLEPLKAQVTLGLVGGSDLDKIAEQMGGANVVDKFDYVFAENGLVAYKDGQFVEKQSISAFIGDAKLQTFINFCLQYMSKLELPCKRGNFIEFRNGMINICPVGRSCSYEERLAFAAFDLKHKIRIQFCEALVREFPDLGLQFAIGGQISIDAFPIGWDKRFCLRFVEGQGFKTIHFFGDRTAPGGNDYELFEDPRVKGHSVTSPDDTLAQLKTLFDL